MREIIDEFLWTEENKVITHNIHRIPGLANFTHWHYRSATVPADVHYHNNIFEIHCMINGCRTFQVQTEGKMQTFQVVGNQIAITFPGQLHGYEDNYVEPCEFYSLQIDISSPDSLLGLNREFSLCLYENLLQVRKKLESLRELRLEMSHTHVQLLRTAFNYFADLTPSSIKTGTQYLNCFLMSLSTLQPIRVICKTDAPIQQAIAYMQAHYLDNPPIQAIADAAGYSVSYFKLRFKQDTGMAPADYLMTLRLKYAKDQLINGTSSITKIAADMNFSSPSHFCWAFKKRTSYSPRKYREEHQKSNY